MQVPLLTHKDSNLIFDVGLHKREDAEFYPKKGFRVVAFEANPQLITFCQSRLHSFIEGGRLKIVAGAIVDRETLATGQRTIVFYQNLAGSGWGTVQTEWARRNERAGNSSTRIEVAVVDFAAALEEHGIPHYMKVDIEGCDMICLRGAGGLSRTA